VTLAAVYLPDQGEGERHDRWSRFKVYSGELYVA